MPWKSVEKYAVRLIIFAAVTACAVAVGASFARWYFPTTAFSLAAPSNVTSALDSPAIKLNAELFGAVPIAQQALKPTQLKLSLVGVLPSQDPANGVAMIRSPSVSDATYDVGAELLPDVRLVGVYDDYVVIDRAGKMESLFLVNISDDDPNNALFVSTDTVQQASGGERHQTDVVIAGKQSAEERWKSTSQAFLDQPKAFLEGVGVTMTSEGYQLNQDNALSQLGLQPGDKIVSVNGVLLKDATLSVEAMKTLRNAESLRVEVERKGKRFIMNVSTH
ncbi:type II secretion system protein N [Marinomonas gallaica]|uniref:type II secretion system protein N n=1 Tax=Marinomonas gallaica TaxID=1806667 RepID=UPI003A8E1F15